MVYRETLAPAVAAVPQLRLGLQARLAESCVPAEIADDVALVATELLSNAVKAARSRVAIVARAGAGAVEVEIVDDGPGLPAAATATLLDPAPDDERARGLAIVRMLSHELDLETAATGTRIRCRRRWSGPDAAAGGRTGDPSALPSARQPEPRSQP